MRNIDPLVALMANPRNGERHEAMKRSDRDAPRHPEQAQVPHRDAAK